MAATSNKCVWSDSLTANPKLSDFKCPITDVVMVNPVRARDGHYYDRSNIEKYVDECKKRGEPVRSPVTWEHMDELLLPAGEVESAIKAFTKERDSFAARQDRDTFESGVEDYVVVEWPPHGLQTEKRSIKSNEECVRLQHVTHDDRSADMSKKMSAVFDQLDPIRSLLSEVLQDVKPPKIIVVGDESSGKSTLLEQLAMMAIFPRDESFCTKLAINVRLRRHPDPAAARATITVCKKVGTKEEVIPGSEVTVPIQHGYRRVQEVMDTLLEQEAVTGVLKSKYIVLYVYHPDVPSIDLVDLPGITIEEGRKNEVEEIVEREIKEDEMTGGHCMFLVVVPAKTNPNTNLGLGLIRKYKLQDRAFGVISQCDVVSKKQTPGVIRSLITGEPAKGKKAADFGYVPLEKGWIGTMLEPPSLDEGPDGYYERHSSERLYVQKLKEKEFFTTPQWNELYQQGRLGVPALVNLLSDKYLQYLSDTWVPLVMKRLIRMHLDKSFTRNMLGKVQEEQEAMRRTAATEVETRLDPARKEGMLGFYNSFVDSVHGELREALTRAIEPISVSNHVVAHERVSELLREVQEGICKVVGEFLQKPWMLEGVKQLLTAEVTVTKQGGRMYLAHVWKFTNSLDFGKLHEEVEENPPFQLCHYPEYTSAILERCKEVNSRAVEDAKRKAREISTDIGEFTSKSTQFKTSPDKQGIIIQCQVQQVVETLLSMVLCKMPNHHHFCGLHVGIPLGPEDRDTVNKRRDLEKEILKINDAGAGIVAVLRRISHEITQDQLDKFERECKNANGVDEEQLNDSTNESMQAAGDGKVADSMPSWVEPPLGGITERSGGGSNQQGILRPSIEGTREMKQQSRKGEVNAGLHLEQELRESESMVTCIVFGQERRHRDYILLATGSQDGIVIIYRCYRTEMEIAMLSETDYSQALDRAAPAANHTKISPHRRFKDHHTITSMVFDPSEDQLVTSSGRSLRFWHIESTKLLRTFNDSSPQLEAQFLPCNPEVIVAANANSVLRVMNVLDGLVLQEMKVEAEVSALKSDSSGRFLLAGTRVGSIHVLECSESSLKLKFRAAVARGVTCIHCVPPREGEPPRLLVNTCCTVTILDMICEPPAHILTNLAVRHRVWVSHSLLPLRCTYSSSGQGYLISGSENNEVCICALGTGMNYKTQWLRHHQAPVVAVAVNVQDTLLASADSRGHIALWRRMDFSHLPE